VGNFRPGPPTDDGRPQTLVDYTFDQVAYLKGGNRSSFNLIPLDGGDEVPARGAEPQADTAGDEVVTVLFTGRIDPANYARGFVDTGIVTSREAGPNSDNPLNINQSEPVSNGGVTQNPDIESVTYDGGDIVLYEFDQALTNDDVIQNTSGLRVYFPKTSQASRIREAGAANVTRESPTTLRAQFANDLPEGKTLDQAVGGFVQQGTVQAAPGERGANNGANAFDETAPLQDSGNEVCAAPSGAGGTGEGAGPTEAPDLQSVGNFRRGPATSQGTPTTCVDFTFDQVAYLNGGDKSNFQIVPLNGGDAISGSTNVDAKSDEPGDNIVTVVFSGNLTPSNFARGYVDTSVVNSNESNASDENPYNINQSADINPNEKTENPDLVRVTRGNNSFIYEFDEPLTNDDVIQNNSGLRIYFPETSQASTIRQKGAIRVERVSDTKLRAFFGEDLPEGKTLDDVVGAFVNQGTVQSAQGSRGGNDGKNAFDETLIASMKSCTIIGSSDDDTLVGTPQRDVICGLGGDDTLRGLDGNDTLRGAAGDDTLVGAEGDDRIFGQRGEDKLYGNQGQDILRGGADKDRLVGGMGDDNLAGGAAVDRIFGQGGEDKLFGQLGDDILRGGSDDDRLVGADGDDNLVGGSGNDKLFGIAGSDVLRGSDGADDLRGGAGADNIGGGDGKEVRLLGQRGDDYLNSEDGVNDELVNGGDGRDRCVTDPGDIKRNCP
jgi:Ca2+-binding RTX toxin-like protein